MIEHIQGIKGYPSDNLADFTIADCNNVYVALFLVSMTFESACASALIRRQAAQPFCCVVHSSSFNSFPPHSPQLVAKFFAKGATAKFATFHHSSLLSYHAYFYASNPFSVTFFACTTSPAA
jgi:hypothetical protein